MTVATAKAVALATAVSAYWVLSIGCSKSNDFDQNTTKAFDPMELTLTDPDLIKGREIWMNTCKACHLPGLVGAPKIGDKPAWTPRIAQGLNTLFKHALEGYSSDGVNEMPPKGGFSYLTDTEVKLAVLFVVSASQ